MAALEVLHRLLGRDQLGGEDLRGVLVLGRLRRIAGAAALSARTSACRAEAWSFSTSPSWRLSRISSCRWLPRTAAAWLASDWWRCCSASMACAIWIFGSARLSIWEFAEAVRYFHSFTIGLGMDSSCSGAAAGPVMLVVFHSPR